MKTLSVIVYTSQGIVMIDLDTSTLAKRKNEISAVSLQAAAISSLLQYYSASLAEMKSKWNDGLAPLLSKLDLLKKMLKDAGSTSTMQSDLFNLLVSGVGSPTIQQFLTNTLTEHPLRKLMKSTDTACTSVQEMLLQTAKPCSETILYRFSQLHAFSMWKENFSDIGLKDTLVKETLDAAKQLAFQTDLLLQTISTFRTLYESFFLWLLKAQRKMTNEPPSARKEESRPVDELVVAKFLKKGIAADAVISLLGKPDEDASPSSSALVHQHTEVQGLTKKAFQDSPHTLSLSFSLQTLLPVFYETQQPKYRSAFYCPKPTENIPFQYIALYCPDDNDKENSAYVVWILRKEVNPKRQEFIWTAASIDVSPTTGSPTDISFYNSENIAVLRSNADGESAVFELYEYSSLTFISIDLSSIPTTVCDYLPAILQSREVTEPAKSRPIPIQPSEGSSMAVGARGVGCVLQGKRRIQLLDLEEDEEDEEEEEEGEDENEDKENAGTDVSTTKDENDNDEEQEDE